MRTKQTMMISIMLIIATIGMGVVAASLGANSANVGTRVSVDFSGLTNSTMYDIYDDDTNTLLERFETGAAATTYSTSVTITKSGINNYDLKNASDGVSALEFGIVGIDQFDQIVYQIVPLILAVAVLTGLMVFARKLVGGSK